MIAVTDHAPWHKRGPNGHIERHKDKIEHSINFGFPGPLNWDNITGHSPRFRHNGRVDVLFADGHVDAETEKKLLDFSGDRAKLWNYDHKLH